MHIEFLYWHECPSHEAALSRLREVLAEEGLPPTVALIHVGTAAEAVARRFPGSPTIRIDGADIAPLPAAVNEFGLTCRAYMTNDGRVTPLPSKEQIRRAIKAARTLPPRPEQSHNRSEVIR